MQATATYPTHYRTVTVAGQTIFYREAGSRENPTILLLHGFPTSSHMYRDLIPMLADRFHVVAPDYPGYGYSSMPARESFAYTFANLADVVDEFTQALKLDRYSIYVMDYGAPVGYRLALLHPERITGIIAQNGNAYTEGLAEFWQSGIQKLWDDPSEQNRDALRSFFTLDVTKWQYLHGLADESLVNPDAYYHAQQGLDRKGNDEIQLDLLYDYRTNVPLYPEFQAFFRKYQPSALVIWGKNDTIFVTPGAEAYRRDLPKSEVHLLDAGHFAIESNTAEIANLIREFFTRPENRK